MKCYTEDHNYHEFCGDHHNHHVSSGHCQNILYDFFLKFTFKLQFLMTATPSHAAQAFATCMFAKLLLKPHQKLYKGAPLVPWGLKEFNCAGIVTYEAESEHFEPLYSMYLHFVPPGASLGSWYRLFHSSSSRVEYHSPCVRTARPQCSSQNKILPLSSLKLKQFTVHHYKTL